MPAKIVKDDRNYYADDISTMLGISKEYAYRIIRSLNNELEGKGYFTIKGRIPKEYFHTRWYGSPQNVVARAKALKKERGGERCAV